MRKVSYTKLPGLPRRHVLVAAGRGARAARRVYAAIFGKITPGAAAAAAPAAPAGKKYNKPNGAPIRPKASTKKKPPTARRVPLKYRKALVPLLSLMLRREAKCPYAKLLNHHCPMPPRVTTRSQRDRISRSGEMDADADAEADEDPTPKSLLASFTPPRAVAAFLWSVISRIVPREMLGGEKTRRAIRAFLLRLVVLRRFEKCTLHEAMRGVKTSDFRWLWGELAEATSDDRRRGGPVAAAVKRQRMLERWIRWLVAELAMPLIRAHFYCTETETHRLRVFYYRKGVWARLTAAHLAAMTDDPNRETRAVRFGADVDANDADAAADAADADADETDAERALAPTTPTAGVAYRRLPRRRARLVLQSHLLGFARLRLLPKATGLRPVAMLGRPAVASFRAPRGAKNREALAFRPVNTSLQAVFDVLKHEAGSIPGVMGANVSDYGEVYRRLGPFIRKWRAARRRERERAAAEIRRSSGSGGIFRGLFRSSQSQDAAEDAAGADAKDGDVVRGPERTTRPPFIVAADVKGAFDSIPLKALENVVKTLIGSDEYSVTRMAHVMGGAVGGVRTKTRRIAAPAGTSVLARVGGGDGVGGGRRLKKNVKRGGGVLIDLASPHRFHRAQVLELLREHLRRNIVRSGGVYLLQTVGIPQGSVLSSLLCGVFYAHLEATHGLGRDDGGVGNGRGANVLCRWTDDLLHISHERAPAEGFLSAALDGFAEYVLYTGTHTTALAW